MTLKWGIQSDKGLFPVAATEWDRVNLQTLRTIRMPAGQVQVPRPAQPPTPTKQPMYRDLQQTRVAKHTVGKLFLFRFLEAQDRPSRKLPLKLVRFCEGLCRVCPPENKFPHPFNEGQPTLRITAQRRLWI